MALFRGKENSNQVKNIEKKKLTKVFNVNEKKVHIDFLDAQYGEMEGKKILLDEEVIQKTAEEFLKVLMNNSTKYNPIPSHIVFSHQSINNNEETVDSKNDLTERVSNPRYSLNEVFLPNSSKKQVLKVLTMEKHVEKLREDWGLGSVLKEGRATILNFYGKPGTGKSMAAEAIATYLGKKVIRVNYAQLESKYVGETPKNIQRCFEAASKEGAVLIFDEADSFLGKRLINVTQSADYGVNVTRSVMLMELEKFTGVVIFTTNLITNYDQAFKRRILANIEFTLPDCKGREQIWKTHLPSSLPLKKGITAEWLAKRYEQISGADIKDIVLYAAVNCLDRGEDALNSVDFDDAYSYIQARYDEGKNITVKSELITEEQYKQEMERLPSRC